MRSGAIWPRLDPSERKALEADLEAMRANLRLETDDVGCWIVRLDHREHDAAVGPLRG